LQANSGPSSTRNYLRVTDFDCLQSPKRPKRPTWVKSYTRDLDNTNYLGLSLAIRGLYCDFIKLAASMSNRVPDDNGFIAHRLGVRPQDVGKAIVKLVSLGYVTGFVEDLEMSKINDMAYLTDSRGIPRETISPSPSPSSSDSQSAGNDYMPGTEDDVDEDRKCAQCDGEGCAWCRPVGSVEDSQPERVGIHSRVLA